jgi:hypothetical protein
MSSMSSVHIDAARMLVAAPLFHVIFLHGYQSLATSMCVQQLFHVKFLIKNAYVIITIIT